jgi:hypothetical protein
MMPHDKTKSVAFAEIATTSENFVLCIGHADTNGKARIDVLDARVPPFNPNVVIKEFRDVLHQRGIDTVMGDRHSRRWALEAFERHRIKYEFCELVRPDLHRDFLAALAAKTIALPQHGELRAQLRALQTRRGGPDDLVSCVAGASLLALGECGPVMTEIEYV